MESTAAVAVPLPSKRNRKQQSITSIDRADRRAELEPRRQPHWKRIKEGQFIGYRYMAKGRPGTWLARIWVAHKKDYAQQSLGTFEHLPEGERYDAAVEKAKPHFDHHVNGGSTEKITVRQAGEAYVECKRREEGEKSAKYAEAAIRRTIYGDPIAHVLLSKLTEPMCAAWRERLLEKAGGVENTSSFNRSLVEPRACLNQAYDDKKIASRPWQRALKRLDNDHSDGEPRDLYLDLAQRQQFVEACSDEIRPFVAALAQMPLRCGEVAKLKVSMLDVRGRCLKIPVSKTKARIASLGNAMFAFFQQQAEGKASNDWLFSRADGAQWDANAWGPEIRAARDKAKLPEKACLYTLRHSVITDMVLGGCDTLTVAKVSGTSLMMIEKHYGHLVQEHARAHLDKVAFTKSNVIPLKVAA